MFFFVPKVSFQSAPDHAENRIKFDMLQNRVADRDSNPGPVFSIPGFGIGNF